MLQRDYLVQMIQQFIQAIIKSRTTSQQDPQLAADSLENAIGSATDIDGATLLSLGPESIASVMQLSGVDRVLRATLLIVCSLKRSICARRETAI